MSFGHGWVGRASSEVLLLLSGGVKRPPLPSIIIFSTLWGIGLREWKGASRRTIRLLVLSLAILLGSTVIVGYGNYLAAG